MTPPLKGASFRRLRDTIADVSQPARRGRFHDKSLAWFWWVGIALATFVSLLIGACGKASGVSWAQVIVTVAPLLIFIPAGFFIVGVMNKRRNLKT